MVYHSEVITTEGTLESFWPRQFQLKSCRLQAIGLYVSSTHSHKSLKDSPLSQ